MFCRDIVESNILGVKLDGPQEIVEFIFSQGLAKSKTEARRLIISGAVEVSGKKESDPKTKIFPGKGIVIRVGKKKFIKII